MVVPLGLGSAAILLGIVLPGLLASLLVLGAAGVAGWHQPHAPTPAGLLAFLPAAVVAITVVGLADDAVPIAGLAFGLLSAAVFSLIASHLAAGIALRVGK